MACYKSYVRDAYSLSLYSVECAVFESSRMITPASVQHNNCSCECLCASRHTSKFGTHSIALCVSPKMHVLPRLCVLTWLASNVLKPSIPVRPSHRAARAPLRSRGGRPSLSSPRYRLEPTPAQARARVRPSPTRVNRRCADRIISEFRNSSEFLRINSK